MNDDSLDLLEDPDPEWIVDMKTKKMISKSKELANKKVLKFYH